MKMNSPPKTQIGDIGPDKVSNKDKTRKFQYKEKDVLIYVSEYQDCLAVTNIHKFA
jgi:hypothetical protein